MKNASTGKTSPTELVNDPDSPRTRVSDWEGAILKQRAGSEIAQTRMKEFKHANT